GAGSSWTGAARNSPLTSAPTTRSGGRSRAKATSWSSSMLRLGRALALALAASAASAGAPAANADTVRVNTFPNAKALPFHAGLANGVFVRRGVTLELSFTENSTAQREGLAAGRFDLVHSAVDNAVAMVETRSEEHTSELQS